MLVPPLDLFAAGATVSSLTKIAHGAHGVVYKGACARMRDRPPQRFPRAQLASGWIPARPQSRSATAWGGGWRRPLAPPPDKHLPAALPRLPAASWSHGPRANKRAERSPDTRRQRTPTPTHVPNPHLPCPVVRMLRACAGLWHGCPAAIKYMLAAGNENLSTQLTECVMCKVLSHPNVVQTFACNVRPRARGGGGQTRWIVAWAAAVPAVPLQRPMRPHATWLPKTLKP